MQEIIIHMPAKISVDNVKDFSSLVNTHLSEAAEQDSIIFDADETEYISSIGLRELLRVLKEYPNTKIINCSLEVYEIFDVTGFIEMLPVEKKMRFIPVEDLEQLGQGAQGKVYALEDGTIVKAYVPQVKLDTIKEEEKIARYLFSLGYPTVIPFAMIRHENGYGMVYEMMAHGSLAKCFNAGKCSVDEIADTMAELFNEIHKIKDKDHKLPSTRTLIDSAIEEDRCFFNEDEIASLYRIVDAIGDGDCVIHGDFHPKNVVKDNDEHYVIDIGEVTCGHPVYDYLITYYDIVSQIEMISALAKYMGMPPENLFELWSKMKSVVINSNDEEEEIAVVKLLDKIGCLQAVRILARHLTTSEIENIVVEFVRGRLLSDVDGVIAEFKRLEHCFIQ